MENYKYSPQNFINRELSWLEFNQRVIEEATDTSNPLLERLKFVAIVSSNLDEFFMIRVASLYDLVQADFNKPDASGFIPKEQIQQISARAHQMVYDLYNVYNRSIRSALKKESILLLKEKELDEEQKIYIEDYYLKKVYPVLTPMVVDQSRPFPLILNRSLNIALYLHQQEDRENRIFATVQVPSVLDRVVKVPSSERKTCFMLLEDIIKIHLGSLFYGHHIESCSCYRITRNADLSWDEEGAEDLLEEIEQSLRQRKWGAAIRLEIENGIDKKLLEILEEELEITKDQEYEINGPMDLTFLMKVSSIQDFEHLCYPVRKPQPSPCFLEKNDIFKTISEKDILLHHPYQSFEPVIALVRKAAADPEVLAIKQTLYRVGGKSPLVEALAQAAENGKQVTVLVELKARFDEQNNIQWAKRLEEAGCHVIYGLVGLKTHCKVLLIVRREKEGIKRYVHMGTGNYNDVTARIYTDLGLFTANIYFGADASALFNMLSGLSKPMSMHKVITAPIGLREKFIQMIQQEAAHARRGKRAKIVAKLNALVDQEIIENLYDASAAGVDIALIVRGVCCLRPGIEGISENITVRSIVGRYLEHSRIFYFYNDGSENIYLSSADWMNRNLDRRVELLFPVEDKDAREQIREILEISLQDNVKARVLNSSGSYTKVSRRGKEPVNSQKVFYQLAMEEVSQKKNYKLEIEFKPIISHKEIEV